MTVIFKDQVFKRPNGQLKKGFFMDGYLIGNLDYAKKLIATKWDGVGMLCGFPGSGKTTLSHQICYYMDTSFNLDRVVFSGEELIKAIDNAKRGQAICFDEAVMALMSQDFATELQKILIKKFTMIRSKGLFILFIIPDFFLMRKYFAVNRTRFMIECYSPDGLKRGYAKFFSYNRKKKLYIYGIKEQNMLATKPNFQFRFVDTENFFLDAEEYEKKKQNAIKDLSSNKKGKDKDKEYKEKFDDAKLKIKIQVEQFKTKLKEQYETKYGKLKTKSDDQKGKLKNDIVDLKEKLKYEKNTKAIEIEKNFAITLYKIFQHESEEYKRKTGNILSHNVFYELFKIPSLKEASFKKLLKNGEDLVKVLRL